MWDPGSRAIMPESPSPASSHVIGFFQVALWIPEQSPAPTVVDPKKKEYDVVGAEEFR